MNIAIKNAGLVLLNNFLPMLFERTGLTKEHQFIDAEAQVKAVHYLQYLATGESQAEDAFLSLNKLLCGLAPTQQVSQDAVIPQAHKQLMIGMINVVIGYWHAIGNCPVSGFREVWLMRDGILTENDEKCELKVERRAYDVLLNQVPFPFSVIKYAWMPKALHVNWPY